MDIAKTINNYRPAEDTLALVRSTKLLLIAGIVGGGKNTVINELLNDEQYHLIISHTTRAPRENHGVMERDGQDYHFSSLEDVQSMLAERAFIEAKYVHGNVYGTSAAELQLIHDAEKIAVTDIDIQGVVEYLDIKPDTHAVFLIPPSIETWLARLERRYGALDSHQEEIQKRFKTAYDEITHIMEDRRFILVVNDDLTTTVERITKIVNGERDQTSEYAYTIAEHLLEYLRSRIA
jgi:guanylate kinase